MLNESDCCNYTVTYSASQVTAMMQNYLMKIQAATRRMKCRILNTLFKNYTHFQKLSTEKKMLISGSQSELKRNTIRLRGRWKHANMLGQSRFPVKKYAKRAVL